MDLFQESVNIILKNQSQYGSFIASPSFSTYQFSWIRDGSFTAHSLDVIGEYTAAEKFYIWVNDVIESCAYKIQNLEKALSEGKKVDDSCLLNARFTLDGKEENKSGWGNFQLDAYGTWLWALARHIQYSKNTKLLNKCRKSIDLTVRYISDLWNYPNYDIWEENCDKIHTSTLACLYGGLNAIEGYTDNSKANKIKNSIRSYIMTNCVKNSRFVKYIGTDEVDASLIWLGIPFNVVEPDDLIFQNTVKTIENDLLHGAGLHRYKKDTYYGGGEWVLLSCWLGWYYSLTGEIQKAKEILHWAESTADKNGFLSEQVFTHLLYPEYYGKWVEKWGEPASPLLWSHAMYIILKKEIEHRS